MSDNGDNGGGGGGGHDIGDHRDNHNGSHDDGGYHSGGNGYHESNHYNQSSGSGKKKIPFACKAILLILAVCLGLGVGGATFANSWDKNSNWDSVTGKIIGRNSCGESCSSSSSGRRSCSTTYSAEIEYMVDGNTYFFTTQTCSNPGPTVGNDIKVLYDPNDPGKALNGSFISLWIMPMIFLPIGIICCICLGGVLTKKFAGSGMSAPADNGFNVGASEPYKPEEQETPAQSTFMATAPPPSAPIVYTEQAYTSTVPQSYNTSNPSNNGSKPQSQANGTPSLFDQMSSGV
jgi:hypothetical protein